MTIFNATGESLPVDYFATLRKVRELSERATLRPAPKKLRCGIWPPPPLQPKKIADDDVAWDAIRKQAEREQKQQASRTNHLYAPIPLASAVDAQDAERAVLECAHCHKRTPYCRCL